MTGAPAGRRSKHLTRDPIRWSPEIDRVTHDRTWWSFAIRYGLRHRWAVPATKWLVLELAVLGVGLILVIRDGSVAGFAYVGIALAALVVTGVVVERAITKGFIEGRNILR